MTIGEWLATRTPPPPPALLGRVLGALGPAATDDVRFTVERCIDAAEQTVTTLLRDGHTTRGYAADLLAADALVTYAFEAAGDDPEALAERARSIMVRLARIGAAASAAPGG